MEENTKTAITNMKWTREWPTEPGYHWLYGSVEGENSWSDPTLWPVRVLGPFSYGFEFYVGTIGYDKYQLDGQWTKAILPELPKEDER